MSVHDGRIRLSDQAVSWLLGVLGPVLQVLQPLSLDVLPLLGGNGPKGHVARLMVALVSSCVLA